MVIIDRRRFGVAAMVLMLVGIGLLSSFGEALRFEMDSGRTKCIVEDLKNGAMTVGKYDVVNPHEGQPLPDSHKLTLRVLSSYGNTYHKADNVPSGQFAFTTPEAGEFLACFNVVPHDPPVKLTVEFDWRTGVAAKDWSNVAKKGSVELMEWELKRLYDTVIEIQDEMRFLREREDEMQELNRDTNFKMGLFSVLSLLFCLSVAGVQVWHLKTFFEKKKLI